MEGALLLDAPTVLCKDEQPFCQMLHLHRLMSNGLWIMSGATSTMISNVQIS